MAYVNVAEWKTEQVCEWLKGLDNSVLPYVHSFTNNRVNGQQLLNLRPEDLEQLGVLKLGHQELIIEAVESLRNFHYELDRENLQLLALHLSCEAHSLHNELCKQTESKFLSTKTLSNVVSVMSAVKPLVRWLDRPPFSGQLQYNTEKSELLKLSIEIATCAQRDRFAENPIEEIRNSCGELAKLADYIIQDVSDPMILQPSSLDLATFKKRSGDELGFYILPSFHGVHQITDIKFGSAAHQCGKMEDSDEIVQVNYQTVVGWERKNVLELFNESPSEILLTLKRRPRHTKVFGQIYIKPYRLPSNKKTSYTSRWQHNLPSPRPELLTIPDFTIPLPRNSNKNPSPEPTSIIDADSMLDTMVTDSSGSDSELEPNLSERLYAPKPRNLVQRRATITGASPTTKHAIDIELLWKELKQEHSTTFQLRDKAASCAHGLDNMSSTIRPQTCLGIEPSNKRNKKKVDESIEDKKIICNKKMDTIKSNNPSSYNLVGDKIEGTNCNSQLKIINDIINVQSNKNNTINNNSNNDNNTNTNSTATNNNNNNNNNSNNDSSSSSNSCSNSSISSNGGSDTRGNKSSNNNNSDIKVPCVDDEENSSNNMNHSNHNNEDNHRSDKNSSSTTNVYDLMNKPTNITNSRENNNNITKLTNDTIHASNNCIITINKTDNDTNENDNKIIENIVYKAANDNDNFGQVNQEYQIKNEEIVTDMTEDTQINNETLTITLDNNNLMINEENSNTQVSFTEIIRNNEINDNINVINDEFEARCNINNEVIKSILKFSKDCTFNRDSSEEKSESTSSYLESICSSNSESDILVKLSQNQAQPLSSKSGELNVFNYHNNDSNNTCSKVPLELLPRPKLNKVNKISSTPVNAKENISATIEQSPLIKVKQTPPAPPPRRHIVRPSPLNLNISHNAESELNEKPKIPDRPNAMKKREKRGERHDEKFINYESISNFKGSESYDFNHHTTEKFFDTTNDPSYGDKKLLKQSFDNFNQKIHEKKVFDDKYNVDKHQQLAGKMCNPPIAQNLSQEFLPSTSCDFPDGIGSSRQLPSTSDFKSRTLEKDKNYEKSVVNKAMMVARSIGLHNSSKQSSGSPKRSRKRNMLLAKRRNVAVKDIAPGDLEGWLTYRSRGAGGAWARSWFILKGSSLYRFKNQNSVKSDCLIVLPGFTASQAMEVKSRKYAFKVYHTGTVFYFAADAEDTLVLWLDAINKATFGAESGNRISGLFSETDESDTETKVKVKNTSILDPKNTFDKTFGSLKKVGRKECSGKNESSGASLDRKYLKFLGSRLHNVPVPTAQFRSYRRVLPSSTPNKKQETVKYQETRPNVTNNSFYSLSSSQSATDVPNTCYDMGDYRQTVDRLNSSRSGYRPDDNRGFATLEEFMLSHQNENDQQTISSRSASPRMPPSNHDHHSNLHRQQIENNDIVYGQNTNYAVNGMVYQENPRSGEESSMFANRSGYDFHPRNNDEKSNEIHQRSEHSLAYDRSNDFNGKPSPAPRKLIDTTNKFIKKIQEGATSFYSEVTKEEKFNLLDSQTFQKTRNKNNDLISLRNEWETNPRIFNSSLESNRNDLAGISMVPSKRYVKDNGYSGSSGDLSSCCTLSETLQRAKKEASVSRKASFNLNDKQHYNYNPPERRWVDSLRRSDKKSGPSDVNRLKNVAQYQPPPMPTSPFDQEGMRATFEMHLDRGENVQKTSRLKSFFSGSKIPQKSTVLDHPKENQKTLLGSPRLHRALFRDKNTNQHQQSTNSNIHNSVDNGIGLPFAFHDRINQRSTLVNDWNQHSSFVNNTQECATNYDEYPKRSINVNTLMPPTLPYIPPPTSPPPDDYPGLEYPPVFEPGTYSLSDASLLRNRSKKNQRDNVE